MILLKSFNKEIKKYTSNSNLFFYWKGRVALYAILKAMGIQKGDEVILPAFTCVVVPNAIIYLGAKPVYVDINEETLNIAVTKIEIAVTSKTKAIICQNTFGLSSNVEELKKLAKKYNLYTIEDCTHGFGGTYNGKPNGTFCDAAFFSTQWNKPFSTGVGGFSLINNDSLLPNIKEINKALISPSVKDILNLKIMYFIRKYIVNDVTYWPLVNMYRILSKKNLVVGSSSGGELTDTKIPKGYFKGFSKAQAKEGIKNIKKLSELLKVRKESALVYTQLLKKHGKKYVKEELFHNHSFLKYPMFVKKREEFFKIAEESKIQLGEWFLSPLHPCTGDLTPWKFESGKYPVAERLSSQIVNLPTTPSSIIKVTSFIEQNIEKII